MNLEGEEKKQSADSSGEKEVQPISAASAGAPYSDHDRLQKDDTLVTTDDDEE